MAYKAIVDFKDLLGDHDYKAGDVYPHTGNADADRVKQLMTPTPQRGALIAEAVEVVEAEKPIEKKKARKSAEKKEG